MPGPWAANPAGVEPPEVPAFALPASAPRVFVSYARSDGESIARELRRRLIAGPPALSVWQDRAELEGGVGWWKQITDALDVVEFLVLVMTPAASGSLMVQREWRYARQRGVVVYPVHTPTLPVDFSALPRWMRKAHFFDLDHEWHSLVAHLARPAVAKRVPFMAPDLHAGFVARPEVMGPLRDALLAATGAQVAITTALQGTGGLGKTTLAVALCHDEDVIEAFDDGIVWVTLGNEPKLLDELAKVYVALTGQRPAFVDRDDAAYHLGQVLEQRNCLIVIDDVWNAVHLKPFLRGGRGCVRLLTTRLADIAPGATRFAVDAMNAAQAAALLGQGLAATGPDRAALRALATRLGEWPLLLELANAQLRRRIDKGDTLAGALAYAQQRLQRDGVTAFDLRRAEHRQQAVARTMQLSLDLLEPAEVDAFTQLAVFPEDVDIPLAVAAQVWGLDAFEAEELAQLLDDVSLARLHLPTGTLRLHDLIRGYAQTRVRDLGAAHRRLAELLAQAALADSDYGWRWRPAHLLQGGQRVELLALLDDPAWLWRKLCRTDIVALCEDFDLAEADADSRLVQQALKLAAAVLSKDASQLPAQLLARLPPTLDSPRLHALRARSADCVALSWLRPLRCLLTPAGSPNVATLVGHGAPVLCLALADDASFVVSGGADGSVRVWDWQRGRALAVIPGTAGRVLAVALSADAESVASVGEDHVLKVHDRRTGAPRAAVLLPDGPVRRVVAAPANAATPAGGAVQWWVAAGHAVWAVITDRPGAPPVCAAALPARVIDLAVAADGSLLGVSTDRCLHRWRSVGAVLHRVATWAAPHLQGVAAAGEAPIAVTVGRDGALRLWRLDAPSAPPRAAHVAGTAVFDATRVAMTRHGRMAASADLCGRLRTWPLDGVDNGMGNGMDRPRVLSGHTAPVNDLCLTPAAGPGAGHVLSASDDGTVRAWDLARAPVSRPPPAHLQPVLALTLTPDARFALSTCDGIELLVWDCARAEPCARHLGRGSWRVAMVAAASVAEAEAKSEGETGVAGACWVVFLLAGGRLCCWAVEAPGACVTGPDGLLAASLAIDDTTLVVERGRISAWSVGPAQVRAWLPIDAGFVHTLAWSGDSRHLALLGTDGQLVQWQLALGQVVQSMTATPGALALAAQGTLLALAGADGAVALHGPGAAPRRLPKPHAGPVHDLAFARGQSLLVSCGEDAALRVWHTGSGALYAAFTGESPFKRCAVSADAGLLVAGDEEGQVHFFHLCEAADGRAGPG